METLSLFEKEGWRTGPGRSPLFVIMSFDMDRIYEGMHILVLMDRSWGRIPGGSSPFCLHEAVMRTNTRLKLSSLSP